MTAGSGRVYFTVNKQQPCSVRRSYVRRRVNLHRLPKRLWEEPHIVRHELLLISFPLLAVAEVVCLATLVPIR